MRRKTGNRRTAAIILIAAAFLVQGCGNKKVSTEVPETEVSSDTEIKEVYQTEESTAEKESGKETEESIEEQTEVSDLPDGRKLIIGTDIHYLSQELTDYGAAFQHMVDYGDGRIVTYIDQITDEFLEEVKEQKPEALILTGDLSSNGEKKSHEALAEKLRTVEDEGIPVLVIPGNHDINNTNARGYEGDNTYPVEYTTPQDFETIYAEFGYDEAASRDETTLSYVYQLDEDTRLLMLDTCQYHDGYAKVGGAIMTDTYDWIERELEDAWDNDMNVIPFAHHNLLDESEVYVDDCTIEHSSELIEKLEGWEISLFISGHLHVQHMKEKEDSEPIREIVTGSLTTPDCRYGILTYQDDDNYDYRTKKVDVEGWARKNGSEKMDLLEFHAFSRPFIRRVFQNQAYGVLQKIEEISEDERVAMSKYYAELNDYYYQGKAVEIKGKALDDPAYELWQEKAYGTVLNDYILYILDDAHRDYNTIRVRDGEILDAGNPEETMGETVTE